MGGPEDKYLEANGLRLHYVDWGGCGSQPMLLLHGFMGHAHVWDPFALEFRNRYRVIALDQRGHGESQWSKEGAYSLDDHFSDIAGFVEALDLHNLVLMGHSMGGRNALFYAACVPERVHSLVLVDSRPGTSAESSNAMMQLLLHFPIQADSLDHVVESIRGIYPQIPVELCYHMVQYGYKKKIDEGRYLPKYDVRMSLMCEQSDYSPEDIWSFLKNVSIPTLVVRGEKSLFLSREDAQKMCSLLPDAMLREIPNATHMPIQENSYAFNEVMWEFLGDRTRGKRTVPEA